MDHTPDAEVAVANGHMPPAVHRVRARVGQGAVMFGMALMGVSLFLPWLDVTGDNYGHSPVWIHYNYGPLNLIRWEIPGYGFWTYASPLLMALACMLGVFIVACVLLTRHGRKRRGSLLFFLVLCCGGAFFVTLGGILQFVPFALSFGYPSYGSTLGLGVWLEIAGIIVVFLGSAIA
ncbi:MAG TPA: hypothetical protein VFX24_03610 [Ktedonobacterales bacterium]|jgi:hypothetical protein|nr:hypothetical protein [Ktedonobacterales bacterium]